MLPEPYWFERPTPMQFVHFYSGEKPPTCIEANATYACASVGWDECHIYVLADLPRETQELMIFHERGHCHGWPGDHSQ